MAATVFGNNQEEVFPIVAASHFPAYLEEPKQSKGLREQQLELVLPDDAIGSSVQDEDEDEEQQSVSLMSDESKNNKHKRQDQRIVQEQQQQPQITHNAQLSKAQSEGQELGELEAPLLVCPSQTTGDQVQRKAAYVETSLDDLSYSSGEG